jgi:hypothetical protein
MQGSRVEAELPVDLRFRHDSQYTDWSFFRSSKRCESDVKIVVIGLKAKPGNAAPCTQLKRACQIRERLNALCYAPTQVTQASKHCEAKKA